MNQLHSPSQTSSDWHGSLCLEFANCRGATQLIRNQGQAPLKVQRPFYPEGDAVCHAVILHTAGGIVGGDRLSCDFRLQPDAKALLTTAAASKVYRTNGKAAQQMIQADVAAGACLEWLPQETIVFNQAIYRQQMRVNLAPNACWVGWEFTRFGRSARGEQFTEGEWRSQTEVWQNDRPLWIDRQWFLGSEAGFTSLHGLGNCPVVASFALVGRPVTADLVQQARQCFGQSSQVRSIESLGEVGVTRLMSGLLCRYRGFSTTEARQWFISVWQQLRVLYSEQRVCIPRVWLL